MFTAFFDRIYQGYEHFWPHVYVYTQPEFFKCWYVFLNLNEMKTKRLSNDMNHYFIHNRT